jgi:hypothetical protein
MKTQKISGVLLLVVVVILIVGVAIYVYSQNNAESNIVVPVKISLNQTASSTVSVINKPRTYADSNNAFTLEYPAAWAYMAYSCNIDGIAFYPADYLPFRKGLSCQSDIVSEIPISVIIPDSKSKTKITASAIKLNPKFKGVKAYEDAYSQITSSFKVN